MTAELAAIARELYTLVPDRFVAARTEQAKAAKGRGATDLAAGIRALPKPSAAAWAVGLLARERSSSLVQVLELGASLRQAQEDLDPDALRALGAQRRQLVAAMAREASTLAEEAWHRLGPTAVGEVEQTVQAAMADPDAAAAVTSGRLVRSLVAEGLDAADLSGALGGGSLDEDGEDGEGDGEADGGRSGRRRPAESGATAAVSSISAAREERRRREEERRERRRRDREAAEERRDAAARRREEAARTGAAHERRAREEADRRDRLRSEAEDLRTRLARLEGALAEAERSLADAERQVAAASTERDDATADAERARRDVERLT